MATPVSLLQVEAIAVRRGSQRIVADVSFEAGRGEVLAIMGASGSGKTTVLRAIAALEPIESGTISVDGICVHAGVVPHGALARDLYRRVGMVFQFHHLFAHMTVLQNVSLAPVRVLGRDRQDADRRSRELLEQLGVAARADAMPHELSGGEAQRVAIARALAVDPPLLLMDEPTASLDAARRVDLALTLRRLAVEGRTVVTATHDAELASRADRVVTLEQGRIVCVGRERT